MKPLPVRNGFFMKKVKVVDKKLKSIYLGLEISPDQEFIH